MRKAELLPLTKKIFVKVGVLIMALSLLSLAGCNEINEDTGKKVSQLLEEKYGEVFVIEKIGNRLNTNSVTTYCRSEKRNDVIFEATMDVSSESISDNYINRIIGKELETLIVSTLSNNGVNVQPYVSIYNPKGMPTDPSVTLAGFVPQYQPEMFIVNMIISDELKDPENSKQLADALTNVYASVQVPMQFKSRVVASSDFADCQKLIKDEPIFNEAKINEDFSVVGTFTVNVNNQGVSAVDDFYTQ